MSIWRCCAGDGKRLVIRIIAFQLLEGVSGGGGNFTPVAILALVPADSQKNGGDVVVIFYCITTEGIVTSWLYLNHLV